MIHSRNLVANGHVLDGFGCVKMSRWIRDNRRNRGSIVDALARVDGTTFAKYVSEVATAISGWLLRESRRCRRHGWCVVVAFFVGRGRRRGARGVDMKEECVRRHEKLELQRRAWHESSRIFYGRWKIRVTRDICAEHLRERNIAPLLQKINFNNRWWLQVEGWWQSNSDNQ